MQFSAGGLLRWTAHGTQLDEDYFRGMTAEDKDTVAVDNAARCKFGLCRDFGAEGEETA